MLQRSRVLGVSAILVTGAMLCSHAPVVSAYGVKTHESLSEEAAVRSNLDQGILRDLGLASLKTKVNGRSVTEWIQRGADFEDSTFPIWESSGSWARYRHHFYNPLTGEGYNYDGNTGYPSPSWGLEDQGDYGEQKFSLKDGYGFLLEALTLPTKAQRDEKFARLFETLGHTVHLLQDAAQPQHTRNDSHALGSLYETYTNFVADKKKLPFGDYPVPSFPTARDFFHTEPPGAGNVLVGKGMAEYSNRGFVTTHTNFEGTPDVIAPNENFPTPHGNNAWITTVSIRDQEFAQDVAPGLDGDIKFIGTNVPDTNDSTRTFFNARTSTYSIFQPDLEAYLGGSPGDPFPPAVQKVRFTFNTINARAAQNLLIPRAVSYSAGLINWFFRGKIDMVKDPANANQYLIKNLGTEPLQGTFTLYYDDTSDVRKAVPGAQWNTASLTPDNQLAASANIAVPAFTFPTDAKTANTYMLVFKGKIGVDIGDPAATDSLAAKTITDTRIKQIAAGDVHTCALIVDGTVMCWGSNNYGQLGNGTTINSTTPVSVLGLGTATSVAAGYQHTCATLAEGAVKCWGWNVSGQLGNGTTMSSAVPVNVLGITTATALAAGATHTCAIFAYGAVQCWGGNRYATLGDITLSFSTTPITVFGITAATAIAAGRGWGWGGYHTCVTLTDSTVKCWGLNWYGALGNGTSMYLDENGVVYGAVQLDANGDWVTGWSVTPVTVLGIGTATSVAAGYWHTCATLADGAAKCWGVNHYGTLGNGTSGFNANGQWAHSVTPVSVLSLTTATVIAAGVDHTCATLADGGVMCWGVNYSGQLGNGSTVLSTTPVNVLGITTTTAIAAGSDYTCAALADGMVKCWGRNDYGQLGDGTTTSSSVPVTVIGLPGSP